MKKPRPIFFSLLVGAFASLAVSHYIFDLPILFISSSPSELRMNTGVGVPPGLTLPVGFEIEVYEDNLGGPRDLCWDPSGTLLVSEPRVGKITAMVEDKEGKSTKIKVMDDLKAPHGIGFYNGDLIVAEGHQVIRATYDPKTQQVGERRAIASLPTGDGHWTRTVRTGPDGWIYASAGSSCNNCEEKDERRAAIMRFKPDGSDFEIFARGLRNAVFMTFHPKTGQLWATNMGRDWLGDDMPPETVNIVERGAHYGWPYCQNGHIPDPDFPAKSAEYCKKAHLPEIEFQAHSAPLGLGFVPEGLWGREYDGDLIVAFHGSWNRSKWTGYKVVRFDYENGKMVAQVDFINGFRQEDRINGRPTGILFDSKRGLYVADDLRGMIYRITRKRQ